MSLGVAQISVEDFGDTTIVTPFVREVAGNVDRSDTLRDLGLEGIDTKAKSVPEQIAVKIHRDVQGIENLPEVEGYKFVRLLGSGAIAHVYEFERESDGKKIALKVLRRHEGLKGKHRDKLLARFQFEKEAATRLAKGNLTQNYVAKVDADMEKINTASPDVIAMESLKGETLWDKLQKGLPMQEALVLVQNMLRGLRAVHKEGIMHRDIKPENVFVCDDGRVILLDFGLAESKEKYLSKEGEFSGSPQYIAPEIAGGKMPTEKADVYAAGVMLYRIMTGRLPFQGGSLIDLLRAHIEKPLSIPAESRLSPAAVELLVGMLHKDPSKRFDATVANVALEDVIAEIEQEAKAKLRSDETVVAQDTVKLSPSIRVETIVLSKRGRISRMETVSQKLGSIIESEDALTGRDAEVKEAMPVRAVISSIVETVRDQAKVVYGVGKEKAVEFGKKAVEVGKEAVASAKEFWKSPAVEEARGNVRSAVSNAFAGIGSKFKALSKGFGRA